jgi:hypothetical protein
MLAGAGMNSTKFKATLQLLVPLVIRRVMELLNVSEREAFETGEVNFPHEA